MARPKTPGETAAGQVKNALSAGLLALTFAADPDVWPAFVAHVERNTGKTFGGTQEGMAMAVVILEEMRLSAAKAAAMPP